MIRLLLLFAVVLAAVLFVHWLMNEDPKLVAAKLRRGALWLGGGLLLVLALTGRLHWVFAVLGAAVPLLARLLGALRYAPLASQVYSQYQNARSARAAGAGQSAHGPDTSQVRSRFLHMTLDHGSGEMDGEVLEGGLRGRRLSQLQLAELLTLFDDLRAEDADSAALLQAYLDRYHGGWEARGAQQRQPVDAGGPMSRDEAARILGIDMDAGAEQVVAAHRRLMQKLHPDRGGSDYLAARVNQAKDLLLGE